MKNPPVTPTAVPSISDILTKDELKKLRKAYEDAPDALANFARKSFNGLYPPGASIFDAIGERFYYQGDPPLPPMSPLSQRDREIVLISLLTLRPGARVPLSIHIYWGLMVGLEPAEIGELMLLTGSYGGIDAYTLGLGVLASTLGTLKKASAGDCSPLVVAAALSSPSTSNALTDNPIDSMKLLPQPPGGG
jgi:alkylhydroperoxidase/carboxymuconolactone decarboxylase family protein YurZ